MFRVEKHNLIGAAAAIACVATVAAWAPAASAGGLDARHTGNYGEGDDFNVTYRYTDPTRSFTNTQYAGLQRWRSLNNGDDITKGKRFNAFSVQIFGEATTPGRTLDATSERIVFSRDWETPAPVMGKARRKMIKHLYATHYDEVTRSFNRNMQLAFQVAIWEIANEAGSQRFDLDSGRFQILDMKEGARMRAQQWLDEALAAYQNDTLQGLTLYTLDFGNDWQNLITTIPAPSAALFGGLGLIGISARRRRRSK